MAVQYQVQTLQGGDWFNVTAHMIEKEASQAMELYADLGWDARISELHYDDEKMTFHEGKVIHQRTKK